MICSRAPAHRFLAYRKGLEQRRMRPLIGLGNDVDFLNQPRFVHFARKAVLAGPFMRQPWGALLWMGILVVFAFETEGLIAPRQFQKLVDLLERLAVDAVAFALVTAGGTDVDFLCHLIEPAGLISARKAHKRAALGQLVQPRDFQGQAQRVPSRQYVTNWTDLNAFGVVDHMLGEHRQAADFYPFAVQVMFGEAYSVETDVLRDLGELDHLIDHLLPALGMARDWPQRPALFHCRRQSGQEKIHEFH